MIQLTGVDKDFVRAADKSSVKIKALHDINLYVEKGEFVVVTGPSGAGKTTLLNLIAGLDRPTKGTINVSNYLLHDLTQRELSIFRNKVIGYMLQFYCLPAHLTAEEQVMLPLLIAGATPSSARKRARYLLEMLGIGALANAYPYEISGGQAQRVALARALANSPPILLADEPTGNLDKSTASQLIDLLLQLNKTQDITTIVVSHSESLLKKSHRRIRLESGKIIADETI